MHSRNDGPQTGKGLLSAWSAFVIWGLLPLYWKLLTRVPAFEILAQRILWTAIITLSVLALDGRLGDVVRVFREPKRLGATAAASLFISANGLTFIWAVTHDRVTEVSLGYYINPLLNAFLGFVVLKERPSPLQSIAIGLAAIGVGFLTLRAGVFPWLSFVLALCFGMYGLVRKTAPVEPLVGLGVEMMLASPLSILYLLFVPSTTLGAFATEGFLIRGLLVLSGVASALPLFLFAYGARRIPYTTVGLLMFTAPTMQLGLAVLVYGEPFTSAQGITFAFIWIAVVLYLLGMFQSRPRKLQ